MVIFKQELKSESDQLNRWKDQMSSGKICCNQWACFLILCNLDLNLSSGIYPCAEGGICYFINASLFNK